MKALDDLNAQQEQALKELQQLLNRQKILLNIARNEERRIRTHRLIEHGAILEGVFPLTVQMDGEKVKAFLVALSKVPGVPEILENTEKAMETE